VESILGAFPFARPSRAETSLHKLFEALTGIRFEGIFLSIEDVSASSKKLMLADLGRTPFKEVLLEDAHQLDQISVTEKSNAMMPESEQNRERGIRAFLQAANLERSPMRPLLYPTRPLTASEITELAPECVISSEKWRDFTRSLRGVWVKSDWDEIPPINSNSIYLGRPSHFGNAPRIAVTSHLVEETSWCRAAGGRPDLSPHRYQRLVKLVNAIIDAEHRPHYAVFPELSIPRRWIRRVSQQLMRNGISLVAGVEYRAVGPNEVVNEARLYLADDRLGFPTYSVWTQRKAYPAHGERNELREKFGLSFPPPTEACNKHVYIHGNFHFGLLICSELTDLVHRQSFRGNVDGVFVLSWNRDLESFASLVESTALDMHCYVILVNNRKYGDSRVRCPYRETWKRDLVRVKGGLDDYFVITELDVASLRDFQSHHEPPDMGLFKPYPDGFKICDERRQIPGAGEGRGKR
jgi:hypothetical protein